MHLGVHLADTVVFVFLRELGELSLVAVQLASGFDRTVSRGVVAAFWARLRWFVLAEHASIVSQFAVTSRRDSGDPNWTHAISGLAGRTFGHRRTSGSQAETSARVPDARTRFASAASCQVVRPVASSSHVSASSSMTFGGVPRVWPGPSTHCTAPNGGTRTSTLAPGARSSRACSV